MAFYDVTMTARVEVLDEEAVVAEARELLRTKGLDWNEVASGYTAAQVLLTDRLQREIAEMTHLRVAPVKS